MKQIDFIGMEVKILTDYRDKKTYNDAKGQIGKLTSFCKHKLWVLYDEDGYPADETYDLPNNYDIWDGESIFPGKKCAIGYNLPYFKLTDGSIISAAMCSYEPTDEKIKKKLKEQKEKLMELTMIKKITLSEL